MKYPILCVVLLLTLFHCLPATASPLDDKVAALKKAINEEIAVNPKTTAKMLQPPAYANAGYIVASLDQLALQIDDPNISNNMESQIAQILSAYSSEAVQKAGHDLIAEMRRERKAHADAAKEEIQALLKRVSEDVAKAKIPEDLDAVLVDLQKYQGNRYGGYNAENQTLVQQASSAFEFTKIWQNYLSHLANGQSQAATQDLQNLSQNNYSIGIMPRSKILALLADNTSTTANKAVPKPAVTTSETENILKGIKTLDDMEPALQKIDALRANNTEAQTAYSNLAALVTTYNSLKAGLPTSLNSNTGYGNGLSISPELQAQLLVFALSRYFDSYKGTPPAADDKPETFVNRVIADAVSREDWLLLQKALTGRAYLNRNSVFGMNAASNISTGIDNLLAGLNQEAAAQYTLAVVSYENALKVADTNIPAKMIGDKLAAIQKDHPKEYEEGMQMVISPPMPRYPTGMYPGMVPGMPYRPGMPGYPGMPSAQPNPGLSIPGATNLTVAPAPPPTNAPPPVPPSTNPPPLLPTPPAR